LHRPFISLLFVSQTDAAYFLFVPNYTGLLRCP
jgi:hypothetical protein